MGNQTVVGYSELEGTQEARKCFCCYMFFSAGTLVFVAINLSLVWYKYCAWEISLLTAESIGSSDQSDSGSISNLRDKYCGEDGDIFEDECPGVCANMRHFDHGGICMVVFGVFTLITIAWGMIMHCHTLCSSRLVNHDLYHCTVFATTFFWVLGAIIYGSIVNIASIKGTKGGYENVTVKTGVGLCIVACFLLAGLSAFSYRFTKRAFPEVIPYNS